MSFGLRFVYNRQKARTNLAKHGVSFAEATTVFEDPLSSMLSDEDHSVVEERMIIIGMSAANRLLFVVYTEEADAIRLIGARRAGTLERSQYEEHL